MCRSHRFGGLLVQYQRKSIGTLPIRKITLSHMPDFPSFNDPETQPQNTKKHDVPLFPWHPASPVELSLPHGKATFSSFTQSGIKKMAFRQTAGIRPCVISCCLRVSEQGRRQSGGRERTMQRCFSFECFRALVWYPMFWINTKPTDQSVSPASTLHLHNQKRSTWYWQCQ